VDPIAFIEVFAVLRQDGDAVVGMMLDDPRIALLPQDPYYDGWTLEFYDRPIGQGLELILCQVPAGFGVRPPQRR
jgi:hypothetical protein